MATGDFHVTAGPARRRSFGKLRLNNLAVLTARPRPIMLETPTPSTNLGSVTVPIVTPPQTTADPDNKLTRVLHLINGQHYAGAERVQDLLAGSLPKFGYQAGFVCLKPGRFANTRQHRESELYEFPMRNRFDLRVARRVAQVAAENQYSLIHAHTPRSLMIGRLVARRLRCPLVYHVHSPVGRDSGRRWANRLNTWLESYCLRRVDRMICVSQAIGRYMESLGHDPCKLRVVPNGVAIRSGLPHRPGPGTTWVLGTMALFRPRKGTEILLRSLAQLNERGYPTRLLAVGGFESEQYQQELLSLADELGVSRQITWTGFRADVDQELRQMDLLVLPSLYGEGLPMVVLEAMANGVPVVATDVEGVAEAVRDRFDGRIVQPGQPKALTEALSELMAHPEQWSAMSHEALQRQRDFLSDLAMTRGVAKVYDELLGPSQ